jgi:hypothetical protein
MGFAGGNEPPDGRLSKAWKADEPAESGEGEGERVGEERSGGRGEGDVANGFGSTGGKRAESVGWGGIDG